MHKKSNLLSLEHRRTFQLLNQMYIQKHDGNNLRVPGRQTRAADRIQFHVERFKVCKYKNSPFYKGVELWNLLPLDIATTDSIYQFKKLLKSRFKDFVDTTV